MTKYFLTKSHKTKKEALSGAKLARKHGHKTRIIKHGKKWDIYLSLGRQTEGGIKCQRQLILNVPTVKNKVCTELKTVLILQVGHI